MVIQLDLTRLIRMKNKTIKWLFHRIKFSLMQIPFRIMRLITFWWLPFYRNYPVKIKLQAFLWLWFDAVFVFDIIEIINNLIQPHIRTLTDVEILRGSKMFGKSLDFSLVLLDKHSIPVKRGFAYAFVTFNTINCHKPIPTDVFIHELTHVWQYQNFGAGYIPAALYAQKTPAGYNYAHTEGWHLSKNILEFNAEQQADLVQDAFRLQNKMGVQWWGAVEKTAEVGRLAESVLT
jgi:hypothetical protein